MTPRKPKPERTDADAPEATAAWFQKARLAKDVLNELVGATAAAKLLMSGDDQPSPIEPQQRVKN